MLRNGEGSVRQLADTALNDIYSISARACALHMCVRVLVHSRVCVGVCVRRAHAWMRRCVSPTTAR